MTIFCFRVVFLIRKEGVEAETDAHRICSSAEYPNNYALLTHDTDAFAMKVGYAIVMVQMHRGEQHNRVLNRLVCVKLVDDLLKVIS